MSAIWQWSSNHSALIQRAAAGPYARKKKVENIFGVNVSHVFGSGRGSAACVSSHPSVVGGILESNFV